jgi:hypothetical protein
MTGVRARGGEPAIDRWIDRSIDRVILETFLELASTQVRYNLGSTMPQIVSS